ncbi:MAG: 5'-nucleotidase C-terminal domain-containing protein [Nevskia sp.]|nr:5'-nucleotidase C-terminal domain-containing protein [Nevskia sp.]
MPAKASRAVRTAGRPGALRLAAVAAAVLLGACSHLAEAPEPATATVRVLAINDFHGYLDPPGLVPVPDPSAPERMVKVPLGGAAYLATLIRRLKEQQPLNVVVGAGDMVGASPLDSAMFHDEPAILALSGMGLEFTSVGNHEFDQGRTELLRKQEGGCFPGGAVGADTCVDGRFPGAGFRYLAANVTDTATGRTLFPPYAVKYFDVGGGRRVGIAFIGLVLRGTPRLVNAAGVAGLSFGDEADAANALLPEIHRQGVNAVVVLIHQGVHTSVGFDDKSCAGADGALTDVLDRLDPSIPLVISGHTHWPYVCPQGEGTRRSRVYYTSAGKYGQFVTALDLGLDTASGAITAISADNQPVVNDTAANPAAAAYPALPRSGDLAALVERYDAAAAPLVNRVLGRIEADITTTGENLAENGSGESPLGDLIADAQLAAAQSDPDPPVVAFMNSGGIRNSFYYHPPAAGLADGQVSYGEAFNVQPFGDILVDMDLSGAQLYALLGQQWSVPGGPKILEVSRGFTYTWDERLPADPVTGKVVDGSLRIGGVPVDKTSTYRIEVSDFLANGGDGFNLLRQGRNPHNGGSDIEALSAYLAGHSPLQPPRPDRIRRLH